MLKIFVPLLSLLLAMSATAAGLVVSLPGHDSLVLAVPEGWQAQVRRPRADLPPTVVVVSATSGAFQMLITPMWPMGSAAVPTLPEIRGLVDEAAQNAKDQAVEPSLSLKELTGPDTGGYYFSATDRQPEPNGYKYLTQGALMSKELRITFTILINGEPKKPAAQALEMLRTARRSPA